MNRTDPDSLLVVVNKQNKLPEGSEPTDLVLPAVRNTGTNPYLRKDAASALEQMFQAAEADGIRLVLGSGYRSQQVQESIYNRYAAADGREAADRYSARPGHSEHQTGLAADISDENGENYLEESFDETPEGRWLFDHAHEYGFILRYPQGKEHITGYMYEPWHYRYVGRENAGMIHESALTLEEYCGVREE